MSKSVYVVAGEVSGDIHGAELMKALRSELGEVTFRGWGGPEMAALEGADLHDWVDDAAVVGLWEVLKRYSWFKERFDVALGEIEKFEPDVLLLVDYPGFNLRLAKQVHLRFPKVKVVQYVAPTVWAWHEKRIGQVAVTHDLMLCLFPFEVPLFEEAGLRSRCAGHPLVDELEEKRVTVERDAKTVGLFPGSRTKEVTRLFPLMLKAAKRVLVQDKGVTFAVAAASPKMEVLIREMLVESGLPEGVVAVQLGESQKLMQTVTCGVVASGTATLEAAFYGMPYCLVYKLAWGTYLMARQLVKTPYIGLINILAGRELIPEYIQAEANPYEVSLWLARYLGGPQLRDDLSEQLLEAVSRLGEPGVHRRAAHEISLLFS